MSGFSSGSTPRTSGSSDRCTVRGTSSSTPATTRTPPTRISGWWARSRTPTTRLTCSRTGIRAPRSRSRWPPPLVSGPTAYGAWRGPGHVWQGRPAELVRRDSSQPLDAREDALRYQHHGGALAHGGSRSRGAPGCRWQTGSTAWAVLYGRSRPIRSVATGCCAYRRRLAA